MKRLNLLLCLSILSFLLLLPIGLADVVQAKNRTLPIDSLDGKKNFSANQTNIIQIIIYRYPVNGEKILGFTNWKTYQQYKQTHLKKYQSLSNPFAASYFYENASYDERGVGDYFTIPIGQSYPRLNIGWNDRISAFDVHPNSLVTIYQHIGFRGSNVTFINNHPEQYWLVNLPQYQMENGQSWNDQISSIHTD